MPAFSVSQFLDVTADERDGGNPQVLPGWYQNAIDKPSDDAALLLAASSGNLHYDGLLGAASGSGTIAYGLRTNSPIIQTPDGTFSFETLPAGFKLTSCRITIGGQTRLIPNYSGGGAFSSYTGTINMSMAGFTQEYIHVGSGFPDWDPSVINFDSVFLDFDMTDFPTFLSLMSGTFVINFDIDFSVTSDPTLTQIIFVTAAGIAITGTYEIEEFTWELEDVIVTPNVTEITVTSGTLILKDLEFEIEYVDPSGDVIVVPVTVIVTQDPHIVIFVSPDFPADVFEIFPVAKDPTGTQFDGRVPLGPLLTIYFTDATGIYQLVPGKTNDTLYNQNDPPNTVLVKIPDPLVKIGFLP